ncbi:DEAD/DEAH box helicase [Ferrimicrobium acidiphilum]|uniref:DEAD/DEAH box helicase n=1 Tax=Ferrimicrobium acidiphilum TaxID=121039 RepID=UPI0023F42F0C|nr:DEAD/DEAH box helicase [Ferrimicrobium acidiphilum]
MLQLISDTATSLAKALALQWGLTTKKLSYEVLDSMVRVGILDGPITKVKSDAAWAELEAAGLLVSDRVAGYAKINGVFGNDLYFQLLDTIHHSELVGVLRSAGYRAYAMDRYLEVGRLRLNAMQGHRQTSEHFHSSKGGEESDEFREAFFDRFDRRLFGYLMPNWRDLVAGQALASHLWDFDASTLDMVDALLEDEVTDAEIRFALAQILFLRGDNDGARAYADDEWGIFAPFIDALTLIQKGEYEVGAKAYARAVTEFSKATRTRFAPMYPVTEFWYPMALLASGSVADLEQALKYCVASSHSKNPTRFSLFGKWVHAIRVRLGREGLDPAVFVQPYVRGLDALFDLLLINWLAPEFEALQQKTSQLETTHERAQLVFASCGFSRLEELASTAFAHATGAEDSSPFFVGSQAPHWRLVLDSLRALDDSTPERESRYVWIIHQTGSGHLRSVEPSLQVRGVRGWGKPKAVSLARLVADSDLPGEDARVLRSIRKLSGGRSGGYDLDLGAAMMSLIGHPRVVLSTDPERFIEVVEGRPEIVVVQTDAGFEVRVEPPTLADLVDQANAAMWGRAPDTEVLRVIVESPARLVVIRLSRAQRQAIQLMGKRFQLPREAGGDVDGMLAALSAHFEIQSDEVVAGRLVDAAPKLRCELKPQNEGISMRLVSAPLGSYGPRLVPGVGRAKVVARIDSETIAATRDLDWEAELAERVTEALGVTRNDIASEIEFLTADEALDALETLNAFLDELELDWPKGKAIQVFSPGLSALRVSISSQQDWLAIRGGVQLDNDKVLAIKELITAATRGAKFVTLKEGQYLALTGALKERVLELAAVTDSAGKEVKASKLAVGALLEITDGAKATFDTSVAELIERLREAEKLTPMLPPTLEAELRPYQHEGFVWAMRLAEAGFGACLADDMGLGKTLQALAVTLARVRSDGDPALVVCPTSVVDNWIKETLRFAPTLNPINYSQVDRSRAVVEATGHDILIVSYSVLIQDEELLASRRWRTLIADEAQAIKNIAAKRTQALGGIDAEFKLALSGTPIENHLTELYSILSFLNPGLLGTPAQFGRRFVTPVERDKDKHARRRLRKIVGPFILRRLKTDVLTDLPQRTELTLMVEPREDEAHYYEAMRLRAIDAAELALERDQAQASFHILAELTRLRRAACDTRLVEPKVDSAGSKIEALLELASEIQDNGHQALVFSQFVDFLALVRGAFDQAGFRYQYLDGSTPAKQRAREVESFQSGASNFFLISIKAGGVGLNLTAADYVIIADPWWNPAVEEQALGRAHRIGQSRPVTSYRLIAHGTIEETITQLHASKLALAEGVLGDDGSMGALPSARDLIDLMYQK